MQCHFSDGVKRTGFLCALSITLDKIDLEHEVDVFNSVKGVRLSRPGFITNLVSQQMYNMGDGRVAESSPCIRLAIRVQGFTCIHMCHCFNPHCENNIMEITVKLHFYN